MFKQFVVIVFLFFILVVFSCDTVFGSGFRNDAALDAEANGMATIFVAQADSPSAVQYNPAGLVQLKDDHVRIGYVYEAPRSSYTDLSGNESCTQIETFFIPNLYFASDLGCENWRVGLGVTSPYGLSTDWADDSFSRFQSTESSLEFLQVNPTVAYKVNDTVSVGLGVDFIRTYTSNHKRIADGTGLGEFHLKGSDDGWGYNVGLLIRSSDKHSIGASYRSKVEFTYKGHVSLSNMNNGAYAVLFPDTYYVTGMESKLTLPRTLSLGYAFSPDDRWTLEADCIWTGWSSVEEDFVRFTDETDTNVLGVLNDGNPASKDWNDTLAYGIALRYRATDKLTLRSGYLFAETPVPSISFETSLTDSDKHCIGFGAGYKLNDGLTIDAAYLGVFYVDRDVTNDVCISNGADLDGEYKGYVNVFSVGFTYRY
ncbi:MAG: OmpP1/FadL family transporter [Candidatus Omnitrophica bacterium]|nr:OmpP1/FadL family transporter [Candidatus Omnitrophota bacterium]